MKTLKLLLLLSIIGCASTHTYAPVKVNYGEYPQNFKKLVTGYLKNTLKDPTSLRLGMVTVPKKDHFFNVKFIPNYFTKASAITTPVYGWRSCVTYNAKNSYGAYVGSRVRTFFLKNNKVIMEYW